jgi:hypothetical protein
MLEHIEVSLNSTILPLASLRKVGARYTRSRIISGIGLESMPILDINLASDIVRLLGTALAYPLLSALRAHRIGGLPTCTDRLLAIPREHRRFFRLDAWKLTRLERSLGDVEIGVKPMRVPSGICRNSRSI